MSLVATGTPLLMVLLAVIATIVTAVVRLKMLNRALEDTTPQERAEIIRALRGLWKSEWHLGPFRGAEPPGNEPPGAEPPDAGTSRRRRRQRVSRAPRS